MDEAGRPIGQAIVETDPPRGDRSGGTKSAIRATYRAIDGRTSADHLHEASSLRLRHPRGPRCQAILVNTAGGIVAGDQLAVDVALGPGAAVTLTSAAAEKIYRSDGPTSRIDTRLTLATGSEAAWIPQETILFDGARLRRRFEIDIAEDAALLASEIVVFGRAASGERDIAGRFHDSWRVRRAGRLVFADETRIEGSIGAALDRAAIASGARATGLILIARPDAARHLDPVRMAIDAVCRDAAIEGGASLKDGIIVARFVARSSEPLRRAVADVLREAGGIAVPRVWQ